MVKYRSSIAKHRRDYPECASVPFVRVVDGVAVADAVAGPSAAPVDSSMPSHSSLIVPLSETNSTLSDDLHLSNESDENGAEEVEESMSEGVELFPLGPFCTFCRDKDGNGYLRLGSAKELVVHLTMHHLKE